MIQNPPYLFILNNWDIVCTSSCESCSVHLKPSSPNQKSSFSVKLMRSLYPNHIPFLVQYPFLSKLRSVKKEGDWNLAEPHGALLSPKGFLWLPFLVCIKKAFSLLDHPWVPKGRFKQLLITRGVRECRNKKGSQKTIAEHGRGSWGSSSRDIYT